MTGVRVAGALCLVMAAVLVVGAIRSISTGEGLRIGDPSGLGVGRAVELFLPLLVALIVGVWLLVRSTNRDKPLNNALWVSSAAEAVSSRSPSMDQILLSLDGCLVPSIRGTLYAVAVAPGSHVTLGHSQREPSRLPWHQIQLVYNAALAGMKITTKNVDEVRGDHSASHDASTMCALVMAMCDPRRARHQ